MGAGKKFGSLLASSLADKFMDEASDEALESMGLGEFTGKAPDSKAQFAAVLNKLSQIQGQLDEVQTSLDNIESKITMVGVSVEQVQLQQLAAAYAQAAVVIHQSFQNYQAALVGLSSGREARRQQGIVLIEALFSPANLAVIEQKLADAAAFMLGDALLIGLLAQMETVLDTAHLIYADHANRAGKIIIDRKVLDSFQPLDCSEPYASATENIVVPFFQSAIVTLTMGMILLEAGYKSTVQESNLERHYSSVRLIMQSIIDFWDRVTEASRLEVKLEKVFRSHLTTLSAHLRNEFIWDPADNNHPSPEDDGGIDSYHFDQAWSDWITVRCPNMGEDYSGAGAVPPFDKHSIGGPGWDYCLIPPDFQWGDQVSFVAFDGSKNMGYYSSDFYHYEAKKYQVPPLSQMVRAGDMPQALDDLVKKLRRVLEPRKRLVILEGSNQIINRVPDPAAAGGSATIAALRVKAINPFGEPVPDVPVTFQVPQQSSTFAVRIADHAGDVVTVSTDAQGIASLDSFGGGSAGIAYDGVGPYVISARADDFDWVTFQGEVSERRLEIVGGSGQLLNLAPDENGGESVRMAKLQVRATNYGSPLEGLAIRFVVKEKGDGMHVQLGPDLMQAAAAATDAQGVATLDSFEDGFAGRVTSGTGQYLISATADGWPVATFDGTVTDRKLAIVAGNNQAANRVPDKGVEGGTATFGPLVVKLSENLGMPAQNVAVTFEAVRSDGMFVQMTPLGGDSLTVQTNAAGTAAVDNFDGSGESSMVAYGSGKFSVTASAEGWPPAAFEAEVSDRRMTLEAGNHQALNRRSLGQAFGGCAMFAPLQVKLVDENGGPVQGVAVTFKVAEKPASMTVQLDADGADAMTALSDEHGAATLSQIALGGYAFQAYGGVGKFSITATAAGWPAPAAPFNQEVLNDAVLTIVYGNNQKRVRSKVDGVDGGIAMFDLLQVRVTDALEKPIVDTAVTFVCHNPGDEVAVQLDDQGSTEVTIQTDAEGYATLRQFSDGWGISAFAGTGIFTVSAETPAGQLVVFDEEVAR